MYAQLILSVNEVILIVTDVYEVIHFVDVQNCDRIRINFYNFR